MIGVVDYGMGNLRSVEKAFLFLGCEAEVFADPMDIARYDKLVLPGVGAFGDAMAALASSGMDEAIRLAIGRKIPFLGICLGMQLLFESGEENGYHRGLGLFPGTVSHLPPGRKVPHIGWNSLEIKKSSGLFAGLGSEPYVYFVHSYQALTEPGLISAVTSYGGSVTAAVERNNVFGLQFHPEKSGDAGLTILRNFGGLS